MFLCCETLEYTQNPMDRTIHPELDKALDLFEYYIRVRYYCNLPQTSQTKSTQIYCVTVSAHQVSGGTWLNSLLRSTKAKLQVFPGLHSLGHFQGKHSFQAKLGFSWVHFLHWYHWCPPLWAASWGLAAGNCPHPFTPFQPGRPRLSPTSNLSDFPLFHISPTPSQNSLRAQVIKCGHPDNLEQCLCFKASNLNYICKAPYDV